MEAGALQLQRARSEHGRMSAVRGSVARPVPPTNQKAGKPTGPVWPPINVCRQSSAIK